MAVNTPTITNICSMLHSQMLQQVDQFDFRRGPLLASCPMSVRFYGGDEEILGFGDPAQIKQICLNNLKKIDQFSREVLSRYTVRFADNKMNVILNWPKPSCNGNAFWQKQPHEQFKSSPEGFVAVGKNAPDHHNYHLASSLDLLAHEFGHAFAAYRAPATHEFDSGALDESWADIFAIMVKHFHAQTPAESPEADWCICPGLLRNDTKKGAFRCLNDPGNANDRDWQPRDVVHKYVGQFDAGGVHYNCGIPSLAFYHLATQIGGPCYREAGNIWINSICNRSQNDSFEVFAQRTIRSARDLGYGHLQDAVVKAWEVVGIHLQHHVQPEPLRAPSEEQEIGFDLLSYFESKLN